MEAVMGMILCLEPVSTPDSVPDWGGGGLFEEGTTGEADEGKGSGAGGRICILDLKPSISLQSMSIWASWSSSLHVTLPSCSFNSEHSLQVVVDVPGVPCSLLSPLVLQSHDFDNHLG